MGKGTHRAAWIAGTAAVATGVIAAILLLKEKSANAAPNSLPPGPSGPQPTTPIQVAAQAMAQALQTNGYRMTDQPIYKAFQSAAGLTQDGFPGTNTMTALGNSLKSYGAAYPFTDGATGQTIVVYSWPASGSYGDGNHPPTSEWCSGSPAGSCP
jgi:peptidoglycan hydrolase-like protein with peptidoglycan-binding domain